MERLAGCDSVSLACGDHLAGSAGRDGRDAVHNGHLWNGGVLCEQAAEGIGNSHGPWRATPGSVTGSVGSGLQIAGFWFSSRIAFGNFGEPRVGFHRVWGNATRSAGIRWRRSSNVAPGIIRHVDSGATGAGDRSCDTPARGMNYRSRGSRQGRIIGPISSERAPLRTPPSATLALLRSCPSLGLNFTLRLTTLYVWREGFDGLSTPRQEPPSGILARRVAMERGKRRDTLLPSRTRQRRGPLR